jgi:uncharacterized protein (DUF1501 family)
MLTLSESATQASRRSFLQVGTSAIGGLTLAGLLSARAQAGALGAHLKDRSVVVLNCQGGPTQFETFDPKMTAPAEIRSITGEVKTSIPGVTFGGSLPMLASLADRMAVVRSYRHGISSHGPAAMHVMAGGNSTGAMMGALYARVAGLTNPVTGMPQNAVVTSQCISDKHKGLYRNTDRVSQNGTLSASYRPFDPSSGGEIIDNMKLQLDSARLDDRRALLSGLDGLRRQADSNGLLESADRFQQQAFDVLARGVADAFDLSKEDPKTVERYDTSRFEPTDAVKKRNSYATQFSPVALGKQMLLARRLCESGCGFVTVTCPGWDMHGGGKEFRMDDGLASLTPALDKAASAFIEDVERRGLSDRILLVITGEFGRTPRINKNGGRDHWGNLCTLAFAGGGLRTGQVIGRSDKIAGEPASTPVTSSNVLATVMHSLFDVGELRLQTGVAKDVERIITSGEPIRGLI